MNRKATSNRVWESLATGCAATIFAYLLVTLPLTLLGRKIGFPRYLPIGLMMIALAAGIWSARYQWIAWLRRQRRLHGECLKCGYSLTGNISGVCPECGMKTAISPNE